MKILRILLFVALINLFYQLSYGASLKCILKQCIGGKSEVKSVADDFYKSRNQFINDETEQGFGMDMKLNEKELSANEIIMAAKNREVQIGFEDPDSFNPSQHIFEVMEKIEKTQLFKIIQRMPKGGILHIHNSAMCSTDFVVSLTYEPHLWQYSNANSDEILQFKFSRQKPTAKTFLNCAHNAPMGEWHLVSTVRAKMGSSTYDKHVRNLFTLYDGKTDSRMGNANQLWKRFESIFARVKGILTYAPVHKAYYIQSMKEMLADGVQYLEFRGSLQLYDLDGKVMNESDTVHMYYETQKQFIRENPSFIGTKFIFAARKVFQPERIERAFGVLHRLHKQFPTFLAGFDLVGQEDKAPSLLSFAKKILNLPKEIKLFFHAGETNWWGSIDENLVDAVLLGTKRIGHGYSIVKHPKVFEVVKENDVAIEVNPISNQVLGLVDDYRNHPASVLLADNIPIVISSDDPSFWGTSPLSHDFYVAFLGIASQKSDLRVLKKFAMNSIQYSAMNDIEKKAAFAKWQHQWDTFVEDVINNF